MDYLIYHLADAQLQADAALLSEEERAVARRRGERYILTRSLLRRELARRLGAPPQDIRLHYGEHGKPECEGNALHFNLSHSGDYLALAFDTAPIGIDVERMRPLPRTEALAARIMPAEQLEAFRSRGCPQEEFFACWCAAEALVKQAGLSIWRAAQSPWRYEKGHIRLPEGDERTVRLFCPAPGYMGALACHRPKP